MIIEGFVGYRETRGMSMHCRLHGAYQRCSGTCLLLELTADIVRYFICVSTIFHFSFDTNCSIFTIILKKNKWSQSIKVPLKIWWRLPLLFLLLLLLFD